MTEKKLGRPKGSRNKITVMTEQWIAGHYADSLEGLCALMLPPTVEKIAEKAEEISKYCKCTLFMAWKIMYRASKKMCPFFNTSRAAKQKKTDNGQLSFNFTPQ